MIEKINITEFRGIRKCEKDIELSKFTVLAGRNNSGKTAVLEAIYLSGGNQNVITYGNTAYPIAYFHSGQSSLIYGYSGTAKIDYVVNNKKIAQKIDERGIPQMYVENNLTSLGDVSKITGTDTTNIMFIPNNSEYIKILITKIKNEKYERIMKSGAHVRVIEFINKCVNDKFTDIYLPDFKLRKELSDNVLYIPIEDLGSGLVKIIPVLLWIETFSPKILLWDDFEISAHPSLIKILIEYLSKKDIQIFISTHSIDVLSEIINVKPNDTSILLLSKTSDDVLKYVKLDLKELETMMEDVNHDPRLMSDALQL
ncbi:MAG: hypothetical protein CVT89_03345 [Candidatus Altiarchaeales archaeon HGW-Altiarchaeales-2]|nr:MAG: hypothetical protein CVT89_03345 [Candidatus Altiarchaeales archaeon HGW-Altiarchaeales-2]